MRIFCFKALNSELLAPAVMGKNDGSFLFDKRPPKSNRTQAGGAARPRTVGLHLGPTPALLLPPTGPLGVSSTRKALWTPPSPAKLTLRTPEMEGGTDNVTLVLLQM